MLGLALALLALAGFAHAQSASESAVKAAFLYKFAGYVEWPQAMAADAPFVIGVNAAEEVATELERIVASRTVNNRPVVVRRVRDADSINGVHMLFIGRGQASPGALMRAARAGTLTVTETARGLELGSAINFVPVEERIGFEVSLESAERSGLRISSRMLSVARRVVPRS
jgi:hypothetical protein